MNVPRDFLFSITGVSSGAYARCGIVGQLERDSRPSERGAPITAIAEKAEEENEEKWFTEVFERKFIDWVFLSASSVEREKVPALDSREIV